MIQANAVNSTKLYIYTCNPEYGINKKTGECSKEYVMYNELIQRSSILSGLREVNLDHVQNLVESGPVDRKSFGSILSIKCRDSMDGTFKFLIPSINQGLFMDGTFNFVDGQAPVSKDLFYLREEDSSFVIKIGCTRTI